MAFSCTTLMGWSWKRTSDDKWTDPISKKATTQIHVDLLEAGKISDPFIDLNEREVQWVGEVDWEYRTTFGHDASTKTQHHDLVFEGLDTYVTVFLNDHEILRSENMFQTHRVSVSNTLKQGENELRLVFENCIEKGRALEAQHGVMMAWNGHSSRTHIRKAQYHYGWDSCPVLMTCGPYRPVKFECYNSHIDNLFANVEVNEELQADVKVSMDVMGNGDASMLKIEVSSPNGNVIGTENTSPSSESSVSFHLSKPELWWPRKYGEQPLYSVTATLFSSNGEQLDKVSKRVGVRRVKLIERNLEGEEGTSFFFEVNGRPIFCCGSNWAPPHVFHTTFTEQFWEDRLQSVVDGNQDMLRIWGGGVYEEDIFYSKCDEKGIMVWHDFMFACGLYPGYPDFLRSVKKEVEDQLKRLRNFCCIVFWAGNNEDYWVAEEALGYRQKYKTQPWPRFPARVIYENLLPEVVDRLSPGTQYRPCSPWSGDVTSDLTVGDVHQWNIWHGPQRRYQDWPVLTGRFNSEFGLQAYPDTKMLEYFITDKKDLYLQSETMDHHNKADGSDRRLPAYIMENVRIRSTALRDWIYASQLVQSECLVYAYSSARRRFAGRQKEYSGGSLVWQLLDCWPCTSWSIIDFLGQPKLGYYAVKRESAPMSIGIARIEKNGKRLLAQPPHGTIYPAPPMDYRPRQYEVSIWANNSFNYTVKACLEISTFDIQSGYPSASVIRQDAVLGPTYATELVSHMTIPHYTHTVVAVRLVSSDGTVLGRCSDWPQPLKYLTLAKANINFLVEDGSVQIHTDKPVKGLSLSLKDQNRSVLWDDNGFDLFPGDERNISCRGLEKSDEIELQYYGD